MFASELEGKHVHAIVFSILVTASAAFAGLASAQEAQPPAQPVPAGTDSSSNVVPDDPPWSGDAWQIPGPAALARMESGVYALKAMDYAEAEKIFSNVLRTRPTDADANFYMGVAKMNLGQWADAKKHLEIAATKKPNHPDPKSRLGVTYAKLGDATGATAQRAELVKMAETCKRTCKDFKPFIADGIAMIDKALGESRAQRQG
jgi:predicted Zn-dependent protease